MKCCILSCKSYTNERKNLNNKQISFHSFPTENDLRNRWISVINRDGWKPTKFSKICSLHFNEQDITKTKKGYKKIREGAYPNITENKQNQIITHEPSNLKEFLMFDDTPLKMQLNEEIARLSKLDKGGLLKLHCICRACLAMDCRLVSMKDNKLDDAFEQITGLSLYQEGLPYTLCVECAHRLRSCMKFRQKCIIADSLMMELIQKKNQLTPDNVQSINRENIKLASPLSHKRFNVDHFDLYVNENEQMKYELDYLNEPDLCDDDKVIKDEIDVEGHNVFATGLDELKAEEDLSTDDEKEYLENDDLEDSEAEYLTDVSAETKKRKSEDDVDDSTSPKKTKEDIDFIDRNSSEETEDNKLDTGNLSYKNNIYPKKRNRKKNPGYLNNLKKSFTVIEDMTLEEMVEEFKKRMNSSNYKNGKYKCTKCYKGFLDVIAYNSHMARHTAACGEYSCKICDLHFIKRASVSKHITAHHSYKLICKECMYETTSKNAATLHERFHQGTSYQCPHCPENFLKSTTYLGHIRLRHPSNFFCQLCGHSFVSEKGVHQHKLLKHRLDNLEVPENGPWCKECNIQFASEEALRKHEQYKHNKKIEKGYFRRSRRAREEIEMAKLFAESGENKEIECEQCGKILSGARAYHGHFRSMHPDKNRTSYPTMKCQYMCEICGRILASNSALQEHAAVHSDASYACEQCGKAFALKQRYVAHLKSHSGPRPTFACKLCGKQFHSYSNRYRHMYIHSKERLFKCETCGKTFKQPNAKQMHINCVHLKKPWPRKKKKAGVAPTQAPEGLEIQRLEVNKDMEVVT